MARKVVANYSRQIKDSPERWTRRTTRYSTAHRPIETCTFDPTPTSQAVHFSRACTSRCPPRASPGTQPKSRFLRYLWRRGFNWKVTLHVHPGAISGNSRSHRQRRPSSRITWTVYIWHEVVNNAAQMYSSIPFKYPAGCRGPKARHSL